MTDENNSVILAGGIGLDCGPCHGRVIQNNFQKYSMIEAYSKNVLRLRTSEYIVFEKHKILTSSEYRFVIKDQLRDINVIDSSILIEPDVKNTAPAILSSCFHSLKSDPDAILFVAPSDHFIENTNELHQLIKAGLAAVEVGKIVTFGVSPNYLETSFGYLKRREKFNKHL